MTLFEGRAGFGDAPTSAIVRASPRISAGVRPTLQGYPPAMGDLLRVACVQLSSGTDKAANLEKAEALVARAASTGADVVVLPEKWNAIGQPEVLHAAAESIDDGESVAAMSGWA